MRFSERTRRWAIRLAWAGLLVAVALLVGLRLGRPLYYTDGSDEVAASELAAGGMVRWNSPEILAELPGPVQGRIAQLPDGRLLYGRTTADGTTDLVVYDLRVPQAPPEPVYGLNTPHNELAPALGPDGRLWFASDRPEGLGGYDLYTAAPDAAGFGRVQPVALCNSALDETDPAPHPDGRDLVFVRIDRRLALGHGGELWRVHLDTGLDPAPLFSPRARRLAPFADRDPAFATGGKALWFVRQPVGAAPMLLRASRLGERVDEPQRVDGTWGTSNLRAPLPAADGLHLGLLRPRGSGGDADLWYHSTAEELPPWWPGQRWLEQLLFAAAAVCALLLLLLHLGRRWSALDLVAQCLLLSLLLHVLLFLWLMGVEIEGSPAPGADDTGTLQVTLVAARPSAATGSDPAPSDIAARVAFAPAAQPLTANKPAAAPVVVARTHDMAEPAAGALADAQAGPVDEHAQLLDQSAEWGRRSEVAPEHAPAAALLADPERAADAAAAAQAAERFAAASEVVAVAVPAAAVPAHGGSRHLLTETAAIPLATAGTTVASPPPIADRGVPAAPRNTAAEPTDLRAADPAVAAAAPRAPAVHREEQGLETARALEVPDEALPSAGLAPLRTAAIAPPPRQPRASVAVAQPRTVAAALRDAPPDAAAATAAAAPTVAIGPVVIEARPARAAVPAAARERGGIGDVPAVTAPSAALARGRAVTEAPPAAPPPPHLAARMVPVAVAVPLRDRAVAAAAAVAAPAGAGVLPVATPTAPRTPAAAAAERGLVPSTDRERVQPPLAKLARDRSAAERVRAPTPTRGAAIGAGPVAAAAATLRDAAPMPGEPAPAPAAAAVARPAVRAVDAHPPATAAAPALGTPLRPGTQRPLEVPVDPPGSLLTRGPANGAVRSAAAAAVGLPRARALAARTAVVDGPKRAARGTDSGPPAHRVLAAAVTLAPAPVAWPRFERARPNATAATPIAVPKPPSLLTRQQTSTKAPPQLALEAPATAYSNRFGPAKARALETFGGNEATERAVADGLRYLARIQNADGTWGDRSDFDTKYGHVYVGKTALCVLAFLGAGHTPESRSEHSVVVRKALDHLLSIQDPYTGAFGPSSCYGHGIATYALAETYGLTKNRTLLRPLEDALAWILQHQGPRRDRRNRGGWGYFSPGLQAEDDYARISVSAWMVMALESARLSGIELPEGVLPRAREYLEASFDQKNGWFRYNHEPGRLRSAWPTLPASTPAGAFCLLLLGATPDDPKVLAAVDYTVQRRPDEYRPYDDDEFVLRGQGNVYFWYYGSLCCFLAGGDAWQRWNERLRTVLPAAQSPDGSFAPIDVYAREAGDNRRDRSYTTAMCVLSLEVYYRYFTPLLLGR